MNAKRRMIRAGYRHGAWAHVSFKAILKNR